MVEQLASSIILENLQYVARLSPSKAAQLSSLYLRMVDFERAFDLQARYIIDNQGRGLDTVINDDWLIDFNADSRAKAVELIGLPFSIQGKAKFAIGLVSGTWSANKIGIEVAEEALSEFFDAALSELIQKYVWDKIIFDFGLLLPEKIGSNQDDVFFGDADVFFGGDVGGKFNLRAGDDVFLPPQGDAAYWILGGANGDIIIGGQSGRDTVSGGVGNDKIYLPSGAFSTSGGADDDLIISERGDGVLSGNEGNDTVIGGADGEKIFLSFAPGQYERLLGSLDVLNVGVGRGGKDRISGTVGNDLIIGDNVTDPTIADEVRRSPYMASQIGNLAEEAGKPGNDTLIGYGGNDFIIGGPGNDSISGDDPLVSARSYGTGNDTLYGGEGRDHLYGGAGNDLVHGGAGNDILRGGDGHDTLNGSSGADQLFGGADADFFYYGFVVHSPPSGRDTIMDFNRAEGDKIWVSDLDADATTSANDDFFWIGDRPNSEPFYINQFPFATYTAGGGGLVVRLHMKKAPSFFEDIFIVVRGVSSLQADDFFGVDWQSIGGQ